MARASFSLRFWPPPALFALFVAAAGQLAIAPAAAEPANVARGASKGVEERFEPCGAGRRITCVVDGDTIWLHGEKIRLADINAPEVSKPGCAREAALGRRAALRLTALLNQGDFTVAANTDGTGRERDYYGRALRVVMRDGEAWGPLWSAKGWPRDGGASAGPGATPDAKRGDAPSARRPNHRPGFNWAGRSRSLSR